MRHMRLNSDICEYAASTNQHRICILQALMRCGDRSTSYST